MKYFFFTKATMESGFGRLLLILGNTKKDKCKSFLEQFIDFEKNVCT